MTDLATQLHDTLCQQSHRSDCQYMCSPYGQSEPTSTQKRYSRIAEILEEELGAEKAQGVVDRMAA